ncbi:hypothetical protein Nepgr_001039 [Nepenthes gracilis]|uniref:Uncharacterized protein n=1 Tax=Nepenthes gracilis TaxID=150966 RepID=A0AAD3P5D9_NEPGR|nr:hypothetical protein Nepgr_001039 [Nepenthes gracilis]
MCAAREELKVEKKEFAKPEDDPKSLQSTGQIIGVLPSLDNECCNWYNRSFHHQRASSQRNPLWPSGRMLMRKGSLMECESLTTIQAVPVAAEGIDSVDVNPPAMKRKLPKIKQASVQGRHRNEIDVILDVIMLQDGDPNTDKKTRIAQ